MADKAITDLQRAETLNDNDLLLVQQQGAAKKVDMATLLSVLSEIIGSEQTIEITAAEIDEAYGRATSGTYEIIDHKGY